MFVTLTESVSRRRALAIAPVALGGVGALFWRFGRPDLSGASKAAVTIADFDNSGRRLGVVTRQKVVRSDGDWRLQLSAEQYWSARRGSTDTPFSGSYYELETAGVFRCVCCASALFSASAKFDSGTGWPSFTAPLAAENIRTETDNSVSMHRIEVLCQLCDAHLGHVFDDGPPPIGLRYCINESALRFIPS